MCTVSWFREQDGSFHLFSSRDEKLTRSAALPPRVLETDGVRWMAPLDPDGGGSWIAVNEFGVAACLLNGNGAPGRVSRGRFVVEMTSRTEARPELKLALHGYAPFTVVVLDRGEEGVVYQWDGERLKLCDAAPPLASSSIVQAAAQHARAKLFKTLQPRTVADYIAFHSSHLPERGPLSPCMHRVDAATVSFTHVHVTPDSAAMTYYPGPLCANPEPITVHLHAPCPPDRLIHVGQRRPDLHRHWTPYRAAST